MRNHIATKLFIVRDLLRGLSETLSYAYDARVTPPLGGATSRSNVDGLRRDVTRR